MRATISISLLMLAGAGGAFAKDMPEPHAPHGCTGLPTAVQLTTFLNTVAPVATESNAMTGPIGGLFNGTRMWAAVVNRFGELCAVAASRTDPTQVWPGSLAIAKSKAYTANAFSLDTLALSTARLYTFTQPGHSLWSLGQSNLFNPGFLAAPDDSADATGRIPGGLIFFGGGLGLYSNGKIIGGLGISGDTSCADHEIAKRVRAAASLNPPGGSAVDDIVYSPPDAASPFAHPLCLNTWRNGSFVGTERNASY
jgi:uncharacterized protein GlcG (DUF336 family)